MIDIAPYSFNPSYRRRKSAAAGERAVTLDKPPVYAPDCPAEERAAACDALAAIQASRPLKPPGRRA